MQLEKANNPMLSTSLCIFILVNAKQLSNAFWGMVFTFWGISTEVKYLQFSNASDFKFSTVFGWVYWVLVSGILITSISIGYPVFIYTDKNKWFITQKVRKIQDDIVYTDFGNFRIIVYIHK